MNKEVNTKDNSFGIASAILGILSIVFLSFQGLVLGIIGLVFAFKQNNILPTKWSRTGKILSLIGTILSILVLILVIIGLKSNPELLANLR